MTTPAVSLSPGADVGTNIFHFLVPANGWGALVDTDEAKAYDKQGRENLRLWRVGIRQSPSKGIIKRLQCLTQRAESLWTFTQQRLAIAESEIRRDIQLWGSPQAKLASAITREQIETVLHNPNGAYQRLRRVMDAWCAMWSWPLTTDTEPPDWASWVEGLEAILGVPPKAGKFEKYGQTALSGDTGWQKLDVAEDTDLSLSQAMPIDRALNNFPWLAVAGQISKSQGFFIGSLILHQFLPVADLICKWAIHLGCDPTGMKIKLSPSSIHGYL